MDRFFSLINEHLKLSFCMILTCMSSVTFVSKNKTKKQSNSVGEHYMNLNSAHFMPIFYIYYTQETYDPNPAMLHYSTLPNPQKRMENSICCFTKSEISDLEFFFDNCLSFYT